MRCCQEPAGLIETKTRDFAVWRLETVFKQSRFSGPEPNSADAISCYNPITHRTELDRPYGISFMVQTSSQRSSHDRPYERRRVVTDRGKKFPCWAHVKVTNPALVSREFRQSTPGGQIDAQHAPCKIPNGCPAVIRADCDGEKRVGAQSEGGRVISSAPQKETAVIGNDHSTSDRLVTDRGYCIQTLRCDGTPK